MADQNVVFIFLKKPQKETSSQSFWKQSRAPKKKQNLPSIHFQWYIFLGCLEDDVFLLAPSQFSGGKPHCYIVWVRKSLLDPRVVDGKLRKMIKYLHSLNLTASLPMKIGRNCFPKMKGSVFCNRAFGGAFAVSFRVRVDFLDLKGNLFFVQIHSTVYSNVTSFKLQQLIWFCSGFCFVHVIFLNKSLVAPKWWFGSSLVVCYICPWGVLSAA